MVRGDANLDGCVNATDLAMMKPGFGDSDMGWADGNFNCDNVINATDLAIVISNFGTVAPTGNLNGVITCQPAAPL